MYWYRTNHSECRHDFHHPVPELQHVYARSPSLQCSKCTSPNSWRSLSFNYFRSNITQPNGLPHSKSCVRYSSPKSHAREALLLEVDSAIAPSSTYVPWQMPKTELIMLLPESWVTSYEKLVAKVKPVQTMEPIFIKKADGTVKIQFPNSASNVRIFLKFYNWNQCLWSMKWTRANCRTDTHLTFFGRWKLDLSRKGWIRSYMVWCMPLWCMWTRCMWTKGSLSPIWSRRSHNGPPWRTIWEVRLFCYLRRFTSKDKNIFTLQTWKSTSFTPILPKALRQLSPKNAINPKNLYPHLCHHLWNVACSIQAQVVLPVIMRIFHHCKISRNHSSTPSTYGKSGTQGNWCFRTAKASHSSRSSFELVSWECQCSKSVSLVNLFLAGDCYFQSW